MDSFAQFAVAASKMAVEDANLDLEKINSERAGVYVGSGIGGLKVIEKQYNVLLEKGPSRLSPFLIPMLIVNIAPGEISIRFGFKGPNTCPVTACATATHAIGDSFKVLQRGDADIIIANDIGEKYSLLAGVFIEARENLLKMSITPFQIQQINPGSFHRLAKYHIQIIMRITASFKRTKTRRQTQLT